MISTTGAVVTLVALPVAWLCTWLLRDPFPAFSGPEPLPRWAAYAIGLGVPPLVAAGVGRLDRRKSTWALVSGAAIASAAALITGTVMLHALGMFVCAPDPAFGNLTFRRLAGLILFQSEVYAYDYGLAPLVGASAGMALYLAGGTLSLKTGRRVGMLVGWPLIAVASMAAAGWLMYWIADGGPDICAT